MISVIIPVLNESPTIQSVVEFATRSADVSEVIVVDDGSIDGTPSLASIAGARVIMSRLLGKGASMQDGMQQAKNEIIVYLDGDLSQLQDDLIENLTAPIKAGKADFVKARFSRSAGRVTILTARPLLQTFFPELAYFEQPLGGIIAARRSLLQSLPFETNYGVDIGLLLDASAAGAVLEQVDIGHIEHDSQSLEALGDMAKQVVRVILDRAGRYNRLDHQQIMEMEEIERQSQAELQTTLRRLNNTRRLALFDMDGTLLRGRFVVSLARRVNKLHDLERLLDHPSMDGSERTQQIAGLFANLKRSVFEETASSIPLMPGAAEVVIELRKRGYQVGIVSDSFHVATEIVRRRVFADFSIAHLLRFRAGVTTGAITVSPAMQHTSGCQIHSVCKKNVLLHLCSSLNLDAAKVIAVGDGAPDSCMLRAAGLSFAYQPKVPEVADAARIVINEFNTMLEFVDGLGQ